MHKKSTPSTRKQNNHSGYIIPITEDELLSGYPISDADLDLFETTIKEVAKRKPKVRERLVQILRHLERIREHILQNDARCAMFETLRLDSELDNCYYSTSFSTKLSLVKATRESIKSRANKFDWFGIQYEASEIWKRYGSYSKLRVAEMIKDRLEKENKPDIPAKGTIRKKIQKPA